VAQAAGPGVVVVDGLPHWEAHPSAEDIGKFSWGYIQTALRTVLRVCNVSSLHVIAESQSVPASIGLTEALPDKVHNLVLVRPLGFTVQSFGDSEQARLRVFRRRIIQTSMQLPQSFFHDPRNAGVTAIMVRAMLREPNLASLIRKYAAGISYDVVEDCRQAAAVQKRKGQSFTILLGEKDKMFPPAEVIAALAALDEASIALEIVPEVTHSSLAIRSSRQMLRRAIEIARADFSRQA
jgi:pimeloyl-ACP methyl ester carboxylesterase